MSCNQITDPPGLHQEATAALPKTDWYVAYTMPNHEKRVAQQLACRKIESFLPLYESVRKWSDRRMRVELPLFPNYVFVRAGNGERTRVLDAPGVISLVGFGGRAASLSDEEVERLREALTRRSARPYPFFTAGKRVRFHGGALDGLEGVVLRRKQQTRVVVSIDSIQRSICIEADAADLQQVA